MAYKRKGPSDGPFSFATRRLATIADFQFPLDPLGASWLLAGVQESRADRAPVQHWALRIELAPVQHRTPRIGLAPVQHRRPRIELAPVQHRTPRIGLAPVQHRTLRIALAPVQHRSSPIELAPVRCVRERSDALPVQRGTEYEPAPVISPRRPRHQLAPVQYSLDSSSGTGSLGRMECEASGNSL